MIQLPYSDELNIGYLSRLFDDTSNCYKFFWFQAILRKLTPEHTRFSFDELINEMTGYFFGMVPLITEAISMGVFEFLTR